MNQNIWVIKPKEIIEQNLEIKEIYYLNQLSNIKRKKKITQSN